ncbi:surface-adhesin E family protein [Polaromonas sp.]|uniref:surface-adhesin E family protein n=1 Tax=Polaromonas sp. TaxID=1869339 RepID=UPI003569BAF2
MKKHFLACCLVLAGSAWGQATWFTVMGDTGNPAVDTIEVDPTPLSASASDESQTMRIRVSRRELRKNWEGLPYQSYEADVVFDCTNKKARYTSVVFYLEPVWQGKSHNTSVYTKENPRWMEFRDVSPNPTWQIIRAACESDRVKTSDAPGQLLLWEDAVHLV